MTAVRSVASGEESPLVIRLLSSTEDIEAGLRTRGGLMSKYRTALVVAALLLVAGVLACDIPVVPPIETATPEAPACISTQSPLPTTIPSGYPPGPTILSYADYDVTHTVTLTNAGQGTARRLTLWVALIRTLDPYQKLFASHSEPSEYEVVGDEYGNQFARFEFHDVGPGKRLVARLTYEVRVRELAYDLSQCEGEILDSFLEPDTYVESDDARIQALADELSHGQANPCLILEALYDYVREQITYSSYEAGDRGAVWTLGHGRGDCTEFTDALLALSRAAGIPARFLEGVTYRSDRNADLGQIKHDWLEAYLPGHGWVPLDPTWGRFPDRRDAYFARMSPDHIVVTVGRNLSTLGGYHYFHYTWSGAEVSISHQEAWDVSRLD
ncbi:MAG: transglutaminase domain-containing protein [Anaerolineae bacterium]